MATLLQPPALVSSLGLPTRAGVALAYSGWWVTGLILWLAERRDPAVRFHAAQSFVVFGAASALIGLLGGLALTSLTFLPSMFSFFAGAAIVTWMVAVVLWVVAMVSVLVKKTASGDEWRVPVAAEWADRLNAGPVTVSRPESA